MRQERLIIFTRYPEPGKAKTRMIPALGAEGAASLHRQMTEHTLNQVRELRCFRPVSIEVRFDGGNQQLMQDWLGSDLVYQPQGEGDLGSRLARSLHSAFQNGIDRTIIIGTDCPDLNSQAIAQAFCLLEPARDLVLGPALDGGYYLIGVSYFIPELFTGISWGTAEVLQQTSEIAKKLNLAFAELPELADVDRPEDLPIWRRAHLMTKEVEKWE